MIDFSLDKLLFLALIALIVLGPEKLPGVARTAGAMLRRVRGGWDSVRAEVERELQVEEIRRAAREVAAQDSAAKSALDTAMRDLQQPVKTVFAGLEPVVPPGADPSAQSASAAMVALSAGKRETVHAAGHAERLS